MEYTDFRARREATVWQRWNRVLLILLLLSVWLVIVSLFVPPYKKLKIGHAEIDRGMRCGRVVGLHRAATVPAARDVDAALVDLGDDPHDHGHQRLRPYSSQL